MNACLRRKCWMQETSVSSRFEAANQGYDITYFEPLLLCHYNQISRRSPHEKEDCFNFLLVVWQFKCIRCIQILSMLWFCERCGCFTPVTVPTNIYPPTASEQHRASTTQPQLKYGNLITTISSKASRCDSNRCALLPLNLQPAWYDITPDYEVMWRITTTTQLSRNYYFSSLHLLLKESHDWMESKANFTTMYRHYPP